MLHIEGIWQDLKYAVRGIGRQPALAFAVIVALALGIGANITIFSTINAVLLNSLPFRALEQPDRLVTIYEANPALLAFMAGRLDVRWKDFRACKTQARSFDGVEAYQDENFDLTSASGKAQPEKIEGVRVTAGFLPLIGIAPRLGRGFTVSDMKSGPDGVAIISDELWRSRFQHDAHVLGQSIRASNATYQIAGVLPPGFELPATGQGLDQSKPKIWVPLNAHPSTDEENRMSLTVFARLKPQVTLARAQAEMKLVATRLAKENPDTNRGWAINVFPTISEDVDPAIRQSLYVLQFAVGFVLLIACANAANLLLTKAIAREKEIAVRLAIGAGRWRLMRQSLTESFLFSVCGGALGLLLAFGGLRLVSHFAPRDIHGFHELAVNPLVLAFTAAVTIASGLLFGLAPSIHLVRQNVAEALSRGGRSVAGSSHRFRAAMVIAEVAMSLTLLVGAGLTIRSLTSLMKLDLGFRPDHLLTMGIALPSYRYTNPQQIAAFDDQLLARIAHLPGVRAASLATALPMRSISEASYTFPGVPFDPNKMKVTDWARVTDRHVEALGLHLLRGRDFTSADVARQTPDVALVNDLFARANWPGRNPLGQVFTFAGEDGRNNAFTVIGVVSNAHQFGPDAASHTDVYIPSHHMQNMSVVVRTAGDPLALANAVKQQVWSIDKNQPVSQVDSMESMLSEWVSPRRFTMTVLLSFAGVAILLAALGLYSVLAYTVTLRTREIGIRMAVGAAPRAVTRQILRSGLKLSIIGVAVGVAVAFALTRFLSSLIYGVSAFDPVTFTAVVVLLVFVSLLASYIPAIRAAGIDPIEALRLE